MLLNNKNSHWVLVLTFLSVILPPLGNDIYFASLPAMALAFKTTHISAMVSIYLAGFALGQLFFGPLTERFGRRPVLLVSLFLVLMSCLVILLTSSFHLLLLARFLQAIGACGTLVVVLAIIRDSYTSESIVKVTGVLFAVLGFVPALAPLLGALIAEHSSWRMDFLLLVITAAGILLFVMLFFRESISEKNAHALKVRVSLQYYWKLLRIKPFLGFILTSGFSYASFFTFMCASPHLIMQHFGLSMTDYGLIIALNAVGIIAVGFMMPLLSRRFTSPGMAVFGAMLLFIGAVLLVILNVFVSSDNLYTLLVPIFIVFTGVGFVRPTASAGALTTAPKEIAGFASALFSFFSFVGGAIFSLTGHYAGLHPLHLGWLLALTAVLALVSAVYAYRSIRATDRG
jgi:MFS transporter, DHA1 family, multidrug resistance protein